MHDIRFYVAGYIEWVGYGIKDLQDGMVEYFSHKEVIDMSKIVKIYGVANGNIDLDWFRTYYSKFILAYGVNKANEDLGVCILEDGLIRFCSNGFFKLDFVELLEDTTYSTAGIGDIYDLESDFGSMDLLGLHFVRNNSTFFHLDRFSIGTFSVDVINSLNIKNIFNKKADGKGKINFICLSGDVIIDNLQMHGCTYDVTCCGDIWLIDIPDDIRLQLYVVDNSDICISSRFNLSNLFVNCYFLPCLYIEEGIDRTLIAEMFSNTPDNSFGYDDVLSNICNCKIGCIDKSQKYKMELVL